MKFAELESLLNMQESTTLAGFESPDANAIAETFCAMSNSDGGRILVGVRWEELVMGRPAWTAVGIPLVSEPGQLLREVESMFDERESLSFDLVELPMDERNSLQRTVLVVRAKKRQDSKGRMSINRGKVFIRKGTRNEPETSLERIERGKSMFRPEQFRTPPTFVQDGAVEFNQSVPPPAGEMPPGLSDETLRYDKDGSSRFSAESDAEVRSEAPAL